MYYIYTIHIYISYTILYHDVTIACPRPAPTPRTPPRPGFTMLCYTILYYTMLYYAMPYYTILCCVMLCYTILYYTMLRYARTNSPGGSAPRRAWPVIQIIVIHISITIILIIIIIIISLSLYIYNYTYIYIYIYICIYLPEAQLVQLRRGLGADGVCLLH